MTGKTIDETEVRDVLWQSLRGGSYDLAELERRLGPDSRFDEAGIDSLDMTDFFLRIEDRFKVKIRQEDYPNLASLRTVQEFLQAPRAAAAG